MLHLEINFRKGRANQGKSAWCVDTRSVLKQGQEKFFPSKEAAQQYRARISKELVNADTDAWSYTFADLAKVYLANVERQFEFGERSKSYFDGKVRYINQFIVCNVNGQPVAETRVSDLTLGQVQLQIMDELKLGKSKKTMQNLFGAINGFMKFACVLGCRETNPCAGVEIKFDINKPRKKTKASTIQPDVIAAIIAKMDPEWQLITSFAANIGLRQGELRALTWGDILWDRNKVDINKAYKHRAGVGQTKTEAGVRKVPLGKSLKKALQEHYIAQGRPSDSTLVFPFRPGVGTRHAHFHRASGSERKHRDFLHAVHSACDAAGVDRITWHDLRHFSASMLLKKYKNDMWEVSKRLGHEQKSTTENIYGHFIEDVTDDEEEDLLALG